MALGQASPVQPDRQLSREKEPCYSSESKPSPHIHEQFGGREKRDALAYEHCATIQLEVDAEAEDAAYDRSLQLPLPGRKAATAGKFLRLMDEADDQRHVKHTHSAISPARWFFLVAISIALGGLALLGTLFVGSDDNSGKGPTARLFANLADPSLRSETSTPPLPPPRQLVAPLPAMETDAHLRSLPAPSTSAVDPVATIVLNLPARRLPPPLRHLSSPPPLKRPLPPTPPVPPSPSPPPPIRQTCLAHFKATKVDVRNEGFWGISDPQLWLYLEQGGTRAAHSTSA
jgi:hypothetical protein